MPLNKYRKGRLGSLSPPVRKPFEQFAIRERGDNAHVKKRLKVLSGRFVERVWHCQTPAVVIWSIH